MPVRHAPKPIRFQGLHVLMKLDIGFNLDPEGKLLGMYQDLESQIIQETEESVKVEKEKTKKVKLFKENNNRSVQQMLRED